MKTFFCFLAFAFVCCVGCQTADRLPAFNESTDQFKIETAVYGYLLERHFWDVGDYGAIFLKGGDEEVAALIRKFPGHVPPLKSSDHVLLQPNRTPVDKETGKPAVILSVAVASPTNEVSQAVGSWYAGAFATGRNEFTLRKTDGRWEIESVK